MTKRLTSTDLAPIRAAFLRCKKPQQFEMWAIDNGMKLLDALEYLWSPQYFADLNRPTEDDSKG